MRTVRGASDRGVAGASRFALATLMGTNRPSGPAPVLALDFLGGALPGNVTFSRGSNATQFDSLGRLVWAPANLISQSNNFASWTLSGVTGSIQTIVGPSGIAQSVYLLTDDFSTGTHQIARSATLLTASASHTGSVFLKTAGKQFIRLRMDDPSGGVYATLNTNTGVIDTSGVLYGTSISFISAGVSNLGNGWYRLWLTGRSTFSTVTLAVFGAASASVESYTGTGADICYILNSQLELNGVDSPKAYVPTTTAAVYGPRFDYNPQTLAARGLLIEELRTNGIGNSYDISGAAWTRLDSTVSRTNGLGNVVNDGWLLTEGTLGTALLSPVGFGTLTTGAVLTGSVYLKLGTLTDWVRVIVADSTLTDGANAWFNLNTGVAGSTSARGAGSGISSRMTNAGGGWWRCEVTVLPNAGYTQGAVAICSAAADISAIRVNNSTYNIAYPQTESGAFATSHIPTFGTAATRAVDTANSTVGSWYTQTLGTWLTEHQQISNTYGGVVAVNDGVGGGNNSVHVYAPNPSFNAISAGVSQFDVSSGAALPIGTIVKVAAVYNSSSVQTYRNGSVGGTFSTPYTMPPGQTTMYIGGDRFNGANKINGWIRRIQFYQTASLTVAQLQALTT